MPRTKVEGGVGKMEENFLQYVWQQRLFPVLDLHTTDGASLEVIHVGDLNRNAGPDFFNAKIKINGTLWVGNVEIHVHASDWRRHGHQHDHAYDNVILHVVYECDEQITRLDGKPIPQFVLPLLPKVKDEYAALLSSRLWIPCADRISAVNPLFAHIWMDSCLAERLERKTKAVCQLLDHTKGDWENALYIFLARSFGFGLNADNFESLARSLPLPYIRKHRSSLFQVEALLFGQSGLMDRANSEDDYLHGLRVEYQFLKQKFSLIPMDGVRWRMLRLRPQNFPHVRIAQFASFLCTLSQPLFSYILEHHTTNDVIRLFEGCLVSDYWESHYLFGVESRIRKKQIGKVAIGSLIINAIVPVLFAFGKKMNKPEWTEEAVRILEMLPSEKNHIVSGWEALGIASRSAAHSQALIQWKTYYCDKKDCLRCQVGRQLLSVKK